MTHPTFYDPELRTPPTGSSLSLTGDEGRHAAAVRRIRAGEVIDVVNGEGLRVRGPVTAVDRSRVEFTAREVTEEDAPGVRLLLVQALGKGGRDEAAIEAATELGVDEVIAWESERSISQWRGEKQLKGIARWEAILVSAMKQSRRARRPVLHGYARGARVLELLPEDARILVLHETATAPLTAAELPTEGTVAVVVGPEGGLTPGEVDMLAGEGRGEAVRLGPEVVRTSTAGPAAIAVLCARLGRW